MKLKLTPMVCYMCSSGGGGGAPTPTPAPPPPPPPPPEASPLIVGAQEQQNTATTSGIAKKKLGKQRLQVPLGGSTGGSTGLGIPTV